MFTRESESVRDL